jgi:hypothetical protein
MPRTVVGLYIGIVFSALLFACAGMVWFYAGKGFPWHTYITLTIGYYAAFGILLLVPIDIACCILDRRSSAIGTFQPYTDDVTVLSQGYHALFSIVLVFGSFVLVFEEYYNNDGYFSIMGKLSSAFYRFFVDTIAGVIAGVVILGILLGQHVVPNNSAVLTLAAVIVTNTVYEFFLVALLAYGLVEYPRYLWSMSNPVYYLQLTQMKATFDYQAILDHKVDIQEDIKKINFFKKSVGSLWQPF